MGCVLSTFCEMNMMMTMMIINVMMSYRMCFAVGEEGSAGGSGNGAAGNVVFF